MDLTIEPLTAERWPALEDLFGRAGASNGCWCMYWRIGPAYARPRADNQRDLRRLATDGPAPGLIALAGDLAVGWCELAPRADLTWLARARYLQPVDDLPVWSLPCFYVRRGHRGQGVMSALIQAALPARPRPAPRPWRRIRWTPRCPRTAGTCSPAWRGLRGARLRGGGPAQARIVRSCAGSLPALQRPPQ